MEREGSIKNLSIGWVVKAKVVRHHLTPGYEPVRKIIYRDYVELGSDILYQNNGNPIVYPIVDFNDEDKTALLENGEYVIMPYTIITDYLEAFGIHASDKLGTFKKKKIQNLIFNNSIVVEEPLWIKRKINLERYSQEVTKLHDFKIYHDNT